MSKVLKGVLIYTGVLIGIGLVLSMLLGGIMFLTAGTNSPFSVFGYKAIYLSNVNRENTRIITSEVASNSVITLNVNSGDFDLNVVQASDTTENIIVKKKDSLFGIYTGEYNGNPQIDFDQEELVVDISVSMFDGFISYGESALTVILPSAKDFVYDLNLTSASGDITLNGYEAVEGENAETNTLELNQLNVSTGTGNFYLKNVGEHVAESTEGETTIPAHLDLELHGLLFGSNGGRFDLRGETETEKLYISVVEEEGLEEGEESAYSEEFEISADNGDFFFDKVFGYMDISGSDIRIDADYLNTQGKGFSFNSPTGYFDIGEVVTIATAGQETVGANTITTETVNVMIETISGETSITTTYGNISIGTLQNGATLGSENGNITVDVANGNITAISKYGNVTVSSYKKSAYLDTDKGAIAATYTGDMTETGITNTTEVYNKDGKTTLNNVFGNLTLSVTGNGNATVTFAQFVQSSESQHNISISKGSSSLRVLLTQPFRFNATGNVNGTIVNDNIADLIAAQGQGTNIALLNATENSPLITINAGSGSATFVGL